MKKKEVKNIHQEAIINYLNIIEEYIRPKLETYSLSTKIRLEGALMGLKNEVNELIKEQKEEQKGA